MEDELEISIKSKSKVVNRFIGETDVLYLVLFCLLT